MGRGGRRDSRQEKALCPGTEARGQEGEETGVGVDGARVSLLHNHSILGALGTGPVPCSTYLPSVPPPPSTC